MCQKKKGEDLPVDASIWGFKDYIKKSKERLITRSETALTA